MSGFTQALVDRTPKFSKKLSKDRRVVSRKNKHIVRHDWRMRKPKFY